MLANPAVMTYILKGVVFTLVIAVLAVPAAWIQQGTESGLILLLNAVIMISRHFRGLKRIASGTEHQFFRRK